MGSVVTVSGVVFVALWVVAFVITNNTPGSGDSDTSIVDYYNQSGHRTRDIAALFSSSPVLCSSSGSCLRCARVSRAPRERPAD